MIRKTEERDGRPSLSRQYRGGSREPEEAGRIETIRNTVRDGENGSRSQAPSPQRDHATESYRLTV